ncbi:MAG TPA: hypothetical protein VF603_02205 [Allosphingosinicella sp.]
MAKPPKSTPHSDLDGVHRDEKPNVVTAEETGETTASLKLARDEARGKPRPDEGA